MKILVVFTCLCIYKASAFFGEPRIQPHAEITEDCLNQGNVGSCGFYQCMENRFPCGHRGFTIYQGLHFCNRMANSMNNFDDMGKRWLNRTAKCITSHLLPVYNAYAARCEDIKDAGIDAMVTCNSRQDPDGTDFCTFVGSNFHPYRNLTGSSEALRIVRLGSPRLVVSMISNAFECLAEEIQTAGEQAEGFFASVANTLRDRWNRLWD